MWTPHCCPWKPLRDTDGRYRAGPSVEMAQANRPCRRRSRSFDVTAFAGTMLMSSVRCRVHANSRSFRRSVKRRSDQRIHRQFRPQNSTSMGRPISARQNQSELNDGIGDDGDAVGITHREIPTSTYPGKTRGRPRMAPEASVIGQNSRQRASLRDGSPAARAICSMHSAQPGAAQVPVRPNRLRSVPSGRLLLEPTQAAK